jgi:hypothetical protein
MGTLTHKEPQKDITLLLLSKYALMSVASTK